MLTMTGRATLLAKMQELKEQERQWKLLVNNFDYDRTFVRASEWMLDNLREQIAVLESVVESGEAE